MQFSTTFRTMFVALAVSASATSTMAGDGYSEQQPLAPIWSGLYIGGHAGYVSAKATVSNSSIDLNGPVGGIQGGYMFQSGPAVFGIEGDIGFSGAEYKFKAGTISATVSVDRLASIRGRAGFVIGQALLYATGGIAFAHGELTVADSASAVKVTAGLESTGYVVGGGVEVRLTDRMFGRIEGLHYGLSDLTLAGLTTKVELPTNVLRGGLSYRLN